MSNKLFTIFSSVIIVSLGTVLFFVYQFWHTGAQLSNFESVKKTKPIGAELMINGKSLAEVRRKTIEKIKASQATSTEEIKKIEEARRAALNGLKITTDGEGESVSNKEDSIVIPKKSLKERREETLKAIRAVK